MPDLPFGVISGLALYYCTIAKMRWDENFDPCIRIVNYCYQRRGKIKA